MKVPVWITIAVGAAGAVAAYLAVADPAHAAVWQTVAMVVSALVPVAHKAVS